MRVVVELVTPTRAIVRSPSRCYAECLREHPRPIDVPLAQRQHDGYVQALREAGIVVQALAELDAPDACFVEDTAVVLGDRAIVTRPGAPSRRVEIDSVALALGQHLTVVRMTAPATLDGGDVLRCGDALVVGLSRRTNREGLAQLAAVAGVLGLRVIGVELRAGLHLKSACSLADAHTLLVQPGMLELAAIASLALAPVEVPEPEGANVLAFADRVLVSSAAPRTAELLAKRGLSPQLLELSEIHAGDGALSCLSLRFAPTDAWVV
jgi:dimethylargininase